MPNRVIEKSDYLEKYYLESEGFMLRAILILMLSVMFFGPSNAVFASGNVIMISTTSNKTVNRDLNKLEDLYFDTKYSKDEIGDRLERLEYRAFGAIQNGSDLDRISKLKRAASTYRNFKNYQMEQAYSPYYEQSIFRSGRGWRGLFNNWGNNYGHYYPGYPTGITPPINYGSPGFYNNSYCSSPDLYGAGMSKGYRTNTGWGNRYTTSGSKSGITILD